MLFHSPNEISKIFNTNFWLKENALKFAEVNNDKSCVWKKISDIPLDNIRRFCYNLIVFQIQLKSHGTVD